MKRTRRNHKATFKARMALACCLDAVQEVITRYGTPEIFSTDQGCQFTIQEFTELLKAHAPQISVNGARRWLDNVFVNGCGGVSNMRRFLSMPMTLAAISRTGWLAT